MSFTKRLEWQSQTRSRHLQKKIRNQTALEKSLGIYRPRITCIGSPRELQMVKIEFSAPKLVYGNNLSELSENDYLVLLETLYYSLQDMGVKIDKADLDGAAVHAFHPSKNIALHSGYTAGYVIRQLARIDLKKTFDLNKADFRNGGQSLQVHSRYHSLVFYDKISDLKKPGSRSIDKGSKPGQMALLEEISRTSPGLQVLRMEVRLCTKRKLDSIIKGLGLAPPLTFKDVFTGQLCKRVLIDHWQKIVKDPNLFLFECQVGSHALFESLLYQYPSMGLNQKLALVGLGALLSEQGGIGMRGLREIVDSNHSSRTWYKLSSDIRKIDALEMQKSGRFWVSQIEQGLSEFSPFIPPNPKSESESRQNTSSHSDLPP